MGFYFEIKQKTIFYKGKYLFFLLFIVLQSCKSKKEIVSASPSHTAEVAQKLGISEKDVKKDKLYSFIDEWYGTRYKYGGCDKNGIDCSCFVGALYLSVYKKTIQRNSIAIHKECSRVKERHLKEGDFVFFKIGSNHITHIGVYLKDDLFVHASTKKGVMISDLNEDFFKQVFYEGGRIK